MQKNNLKLLVMNKKSKKGQWQLNKKRHKTIIKKENLRMIADLIMGFILRFLKLEWQKI